MAEFSEEAGKTALIELVNVSKNFDGVQAVDRLKLRHNKNEILGLIGPNGAGKTTVVNLISGMDELSSGSILYRGSDISAFPPHKRSAVGIARTFQTIRLFAEMNVLDNVLTGRYLRINANLRRWQWLLPGSQKQLEEHYDKCMDCLRVLGIDHLAKQKASELSYGSQRQAELARAMAGEPELLLLDEPAAGMTPRETAELGEQILDLKQRGITIMVIEHDMGLINRVCDRVAVLNFGSLITVNTPENIRNNPEVIEAYLGRED